MDNYKSPDCLSLAVIPCHVKVSTFTKLEHLDRMIIRVTKIQMHIYVPSIKNGSAVAQWLSACLEIEGSGFEALRRHCVVSLSRTQLSLPNTGSAQ